MIQIFKVFTEIAIFSRKKAIFQCIMIHIHCSAFSKPSTIGWYTELVEMLPKGLAIPGVSLVIPGLTGDLLITPSFLFPFEVFAIPSVPLPA